MKNVIVLTKFRRLVKLLAISFFFLVSGIISSAFTVSSSNDGVTSDKDSTQSGKSSFREFFSNSAFDPVQPSIEGLNPKASKFVQAFVAANTDRLTRMKVWGKPYFDMYDGILAQHGLPSELKYLSVIESSLNAGALSRAGALGPWQIMPVEARRLGLKVNRRVDDRKDYYKSTHAAARFMKELHAQFNDWILVVAAYNCGPGRLRQAIRKSGSTDFWKLQSYLPLETRNHVKKFIGTHYVFEGVGFATMTSAEIAGNTLRVATPKVSVAAAEDERTQTLTVDITGKYHSNIIAKRVGMDIQTFSHFNPNFDKIIARGLSYTMRLPVDKMMKFDANKQQILDECFQLLLR